MPATAMPDRVPSVPGDEVRSQSVIRFPRPSSLHLAHVLLGAPFFTAVALATSTESSSAARPKCFEKRATIVGGPNGNTLHGTEHADVIVGGGGNDKIDGRG